MNKKALIKRVVYSMPFVRGLFYRLRLYKKCNREVGYQSFGDFLKQHRDKIYLVPPMDTVKRFSNLLEHLSIEPIESSMFFYSIDIYKGFLPIRNILNNFTMDYRIAVQGSFADVRHKLESQYDDFSRDELKTLEAMSSYLSRCYQNADIMSKYGNQIKAISTLFERHAQSFFEALQRILFVNQFIWQTGHTLVGLGHLDWILIDLYREDIRCGKLTRSDAAEMLKEFFRVLHGAYSFKSSTSLLGDTGQIIILGGLESEGEYRCNELTDLFIEVSEDLRLPDPKVLLRCSDLMPERLLRSAVKCISTGIGAPLLSNDDAVIPALISAGYSKDDVYQYGASACWEPLIPGVSCEQNNIATINFAMPLVRMMKTKAFEKSADEGSVLQLYFEELDNYLGEILQPLTTLIFDQDPLLSLLSPSALEKHVDFTQGGANYNGIGLTSVGLGTTVNSLLNLSRLVFTEKRYSIHELNTILNNNFFEQDALLQELKNSLPCYGCDEENVVELSKKIINKTSDVMKRYHTELGGSFKFGLSSPSYISGAKNIPATLDGRKSGEPFSVHISSRTALPPTELLNFAMKMDYFENRLNGNVIDFFASPDALQKNLEQYVAMLQVGIKGGIFQLQMNVVDSKTLIAAKSDPKLFPQLVVRVWGFSAYFNDLPEEYKDLLIARAIESEKAA